MAGKGGMLALLALGVGAAVMMSKKSSAAINATPATAANGLPPGTGLYDTKPAPPNAVMPLTLEQTVTKELTTDSSVANLQQLATALAPMWPIAVSLLNARIAQLQVQPVPNPTPAPAPVTPPPLPAPAPAPAPSPAPAPAPVVVTPVTPVTPAPVVVPPAPVAPVTPVTPPTPAPVTPAATTYPLWSTTASASAGMTTGPDVSATAIPAAYQAQSDETEGVQTAINNWIAQVQAPIPPLTVDGLYGPSQNPPQGANSLTQQAVAMFQNYVNDTNMVSPPLTVDGLAGPLTQTPLLNFGTIPDGGPY